MIDENIFFWVLWGLIVVLIIIVNIMYCNLQKYLSEKENISIEYSIVNNSKVLIYVYRYGNKILSLEVNIIDKQDYDELIY